MRLELNKQLRTDLDKIKAKEVRFGKHGHTQTVEFLVRYYHERSTLKEIKESVINTMKTLPESIEHNIWEAVIHNLRGIIAGIVLNSLPAVRKPKKRRKSDAAGSHSAVIQDE